MAVGFEQSVPGAHSQRPFSLGVQFDCREAAIALAKEEARGACRVWELKVWACVYMSHYAVVCFIM